jgi:hypothetical protein
MQITPLQLFVFMQGQVLAVRTNGTMELTRTIKSFRRDFKAAIGLPARASHLDVLIAIGFAYNQFNKLEKYWEYINKPHNLVDGKPLVTPEMLKQKYGI